jgi:hypothetical protein
MRSAALFTLTRECAVTGRAPYVLFAKCGSGVGWRGHRLTNVTVGVNSWAARRRVCVGSEAALAVACRRCDRHRLGLAGTSGLGELPDLV